jgi:hypothetical protein
MLDTPGYAAVVRSLRVLLGFKLAFWSAALASASALQRSARSR